MTTAPFSPSFRQRMARYALAALPWVAFLAFMAWTWGGRDLFTTVPHYGDALENIAGATWVGDAIATGQNPLVYPYNYFPEGWRVGSHSVGILEYFLLAPLVRLGGGSFAGGAFAYNIAFLAACLAAFGGALLFARRHLSPVIATLVALAMTFWAMRWHQGMEGRLNIVWASALLPWMLWGLERAFDAVSWRQRVGWLVFIAVPWALAFNFSLYFAYIGGIMLAAWALFLKGGAIGAWPKRVLALCIVGALLLLFGAPWLALNLHESAIAQPSFYSMEEVNFSGASLNSLPIPFLYHPWLANFARSLYRGDPWEQGMGNLGLAWSIMAVVGAIVARRHKAWLAAVVLSTVCLVFALGLTLHWDGQPVQWPVLRPLNQVIWQVGHAIKPDFFTDAQPGAIFADAVPLPALLLSIVVPFWERGRIYTRYTLAASLGLYLLAGMALMRLRDLWPRRPAVGRVLQVAAAAVLLFEIIPPRLEVQPYPPAGHDAYTWLSQQNLDGQGIANVFAAHPSTLVLSIHGYNLLAVSFHKQATVAGAAGVRPLHTVVLNEWLATHEHPFWQPDFAQIMRSYRVKYILMEMQTDWEEGLWQEAQAAKEIEPVQCFPAPQGTSPWPWPICILEVLPSRSPDVNLLLHDGWSGREDWGVWAEGTVSQAQFVATSRTPFQLEVAVFPLCVPDKSQRIALDVNGQEVASYTWSNCDPWKATVAIPATLVRVGFNDVTVRAAYAEPPPQAGGSDTRKLSVGFSRLKISTR